MKDTTIERVTSFKLLGLWVDDNLKWNTNTNHVIKKAAKRLYLLKVLKSYGAPEKDLMAFYTSVIRSVLEYGAQVWHGSLTGEQCYDIERIQKRALRITSANLTPNPVGDKNPVGGIDKISNLYFVPFQKVNKLEH